MPSLAYATNPDPSAQGETWHPPGSVIETEGAANPHLRLVVSGWAACCRLLTDGRRQILSLALPGEVLVTSPDLGPGLAQAVALTRARILDLGALAEIAADERPQGRQLRQVATLAAARDHAALLRHIVRLGAMSASERASHLLLELHERQQGRVPARGDGMAMPLTQEILADLLGLSIVHVNRTLQHLKRQGLITYRSGRVTFLDPAALAEACGYEPIGRPVTLVRS